MSDSAPVVLLVDDHADTLSMYETYLDAAGLQTMTAQSAEEAFQRACQGRPDVVVSDILLPGDSGLDLVRRLRDDVRTRDMAIILLSGYRVDTAEQQSSARADRLLLKPCLPNTLVDEIRDVLSIERRRQD